MAQTQDNSSATIPLARPPSHQIPISAAQKPKPFPPTVSRTSTLLPPNKGQFSPDVYLRTPQTQKLDSSPLKIRISFSLQSPNCSKPCSRRPQETDSFVLAYPPKCF